MKVHAAFVAVVLAFAAQAGAAADWLQIAPAAYGARSTWEPVPEEFFAEVPASKLPFAEFQLAEQPFVSQSSAAVAERLGRGRTFTCAAGLQAFLVRGLYENGATGRFSLYWAKSALVVVHESLGPARVPSRSALITCLAHAPVAVFSNLAGAL
jgi:hypothetical protein